MKFSSLIATAAALALSGSVFAQTSAADHAAHHPAGASAPASTTPMADGEVRKIDKDAKKITLKHGELKALDMPPMTMVFQVSDPALLDRVKAGDKVKFKAEKIGGAFVVTAIEAAR